MPVTVPASGRAEVLLCGSVSSCTGTDVCCVSTEAAVVWAVLLPGPCSPLVKLSLPVPQAVRTDSGSSNAAPAEKSRSIRVGLPICASVLSQIAGGFLPLFLLIHNLVGLCNQRKKLHIRLNLRDE